MVRIIERETISNKELFDKLYTLSLGHTFNSMVKSKILLHLFIRVLNLQTIPLLLISQIEEYCEKYPYTILKV